jgi:hypothetical protein
LTKKESLMVDERYQVIFSGRVLPGRDRAEVRQRLGQMFRIAGAQLERLFSGIPIAIKKDIDLDTATRVREAFKGAGALVELKKMGDRPAQAKAEAARPAGPGAPPPAPQTPDAARSLELAPARTGDLLDCAPTEPPTPLRDTGHLELAEPGAQVAPPTQEGAAAPLPDTSGWELAQPGARMSDDRQPRPGPQVDLSGLELSPPRTGSLQGYARLEPPAIIPSTEHLEVVGSDKR